ncbi:uncharacterized protein LOC131051075 isoform X3 [Cryptomeria japonica]|uniref:uncharacterized protein LOC131051075 isoform X3 n=1 Tax=Cryptomeria japonica TaxID=3369 RepID=UPI0027DA3145|nr:uncharacterized protein LOC131051075 isoform X3 [Cryptomeria japonica]
MAGTRCVAISTCFYPTAIPTPHLSKSFLVARFSIAQWKHTRVLCTERANKAAIKESHELVEIEYAELNLNQNIGEKFGGVRIRQHVNPLKASLMGQVMFQFKAHLKIIPLLNHLIGRIFLKTQDYLLWWILAVVCHVILRSGRFLILLAKRFCGTKNFLGLDIRDKLVQRSQFWAKELAIKNIHFMVANATVSFGALISTYPGPLTCVSILRFLSLRQVLRVCGGFFVFVAGYLCVCCRCRAYLLHRCRAYLLHRCRPVVFKKASSIINVLVCPTCPDPHFKKKHHKRRILQKPLADAIINNLAPGGQGGPKERMKISNQLDRIKFQLLQLHKNDAFCSKQLQQMLKSRL